MFGIICSVEKDDLWHAPDTYLIDLAKKEIIKIGLLEEEKINYGFVSP